MLCDGRAHAPLAPDGVLAPLDLRTLDGARYASRQGAPPFGVGGMLSGRWAALRERRSGPFRELTTALFSRRAARHLCGYTFGMKTAVSLPEDVFEEAERLARRLRKSRSALYRDAIAEYVARHDPDVLTAKIDQVIEGSDEEHAGFVRAAARRTLERADW